MAIDSPSYTSDNSRATAMAGLAIAVSLVAFLVSLFSFFATRTTEIEEAATSNENTIQTRQTIDTVTTSPTPSPTNTSQGIMSSIRNSIISFSQTINDDITQEDFLAAIAGFRTAITNSTQFVSSEAQSELRELDTSLQGIEAEARRDLAGAIQSLKELADRLQQDILDDEANQPLD